MYTGVKYVSYSKLNTVFMNESEIRSRLDNHIGCNQWYKHNIFKSFKYTEGVLDMAEMCKAHWMISDIIVIGAMKLKEEEFVSVEIHREIGYPGILIKYTDGNENDLFEQTYSKTDFPLFNTIEEGISKPALTLFMTDRTLLLTAEY